MNKRVILSEEEMTALLKEFADWNKGQFDHAEFASSAGGYIVVFRKESKEEIARIGGTYSGYEGDAVNGK